MTQIAHAQALITTARTTLRPLRGSDVGLISLYTSDPRVARMSETIPYPNPPGAVEAYVRGGVWADRWAIDVSQSFGTEIVGTVNLTRDGDLSFWIAPFFSGLGLAPEAVDGVLQATHHKRVTARNFVDNPCAAHVLRRCGFEKTGTTQSYSVARGEAVVADIYERDRPCA